jgi:DNA polymerase III subunit epsilon
MNLFFDTETTGIPRNYKALVSDLDNWPRLVQIAWIVMDDSENEIKSAEYIIKPNGFLIPKEAARIHGITTELASKSGVDLGPVLEEITEDIAAAAAIIAHNMQFDEKILGAEFLRMGHLNAIDGKPRKCTMQSSKNFCRIPGPYGNKWPKLQELYKILFLEGFGNAHSALADVRACSKCYFELRRIGVMT